MQQRRYGHEENNVGHRQDDRRRLRPTSESSRDHLAESGVNSFQRGARTRTDRCRERLETTEEKVTCVVRRMRLPHDFAFRKHLYYGPVH